VDLLGLSEEEFRRRFRGTALMRAKRRGLLRNAALVLGNRAIRPACLLWRKHAWILSPSCGKPPSGQFSGSNKAQQDPEEDPQRHRKSLCFLFPKR